MGILGLFFKNKKQPKKTSKTVLIDDVEYKYIKNKKSKSVKITVKDRFHVNISLPYSLSYKDAETFVFKKSNVINKTLNLCDFNLIDKEFKTKSNNLKINAAFIQKPDIKQKKGIVYFNYPLNSDFYSKEIQSALKIAVKKAFYIEAKEYLPRRINELAQKYGFKYNKLALKVHKTRWGSCSINNNINLNINLMNLENNFIDYVLLHELCHTVEKNHKENFWKLLSGIMPDAKMISRELKKQKCII